MKRELTAEPDLEPLAAWEAADPARVAAVAPSISVIELYRAQIVTLKPVFEGLLWDRLTMLIARPKAGKSWLTLQLAVHIAGGRTVDGITALDRGPALYGAFEEPKARTTWVAVPSNLPRSSRRCSPGWLCWTRSPRS